MGMLLMEDLNLTKYLHLGYMCEEDTQMLKAFQARLTCSWSSCLLQAAVKLLHLLKQIIK